MQDGGRRWFWLAAASLTYGLALGARPSLLLGAVILLVPVAQAWREKRPTRLLLLAAAIPIVLIGLGLMGYNALRFDNPLEFGQRYQLPITEHQQFSLRYFWFNFRVMFLDPARWSGSFPFVHDIAAHKLPVGYGNVDHPFGILTNIPLVWVALAAPLAWRSGSEEARSMPRWFLAALALLFGMCALPFCVHDSLCLRYEMEYASPLMLLAVVGALALDRALAGRPVWRRAARGGWILLLAFSVVFNLFASFQLQADGDAYFGYALVRAGRVDEAILQYREALEFRPDFAEIRNNYGSALAMKGNLDEAAAQYRFALKLAPDYPEAERNLGKVLLLKGDFDAALACLDKNPAGSPDPLARWSKVGKEFLQEPDWQCAIVCYRQATNINSRSADAYANLGLAFVKRAEIQEAIDCWQKALEIKPDQLLVLNNLAWLLATTPDASLRNGAKAVTLAKQAGQLAGDANPMALHTLAAAYAEEGSYSLAAVTARRGLGLALEQKNNALAASLQKEIQLYEAGKPVRDGTAASSAPTGRDGTTKGSETEQQKEAPQRGGPTGRVAPP